MRPAERTKLCASMSGRLAFIFLSLTDCVSFSLNFHLFLLKLPVIQILSFLRQSENNAVLKCTQDNFIVLWELQQVCETILKGGIKNEEVSTHLAHFQGRAPVTPPNCKVPSVSQLTINIYWIKAKHGDKAKLGNYESELIRVTKWICNYVYYLELNLGIANYVICFL